MACAKKQNKPLLIDFNGHSCTNCKLMENKVWPDKRILEAMKNNFVIVSLYIDDRTKLPENEQFTTKEGKMINTLGKKNAHFQISRFNSNSQPFYVIMDHNDQSLGAPLGLTLNADEFLKFLNEGEEKFQQIK
ncbi:MAG: thioredoxin fold domain-containing protein [Bacteroidales bacterium]|nr:thioredoxin fold domain-containing protein [Bacteroidales bacterium]